MERSFLSQVPTETLRKIQQEALDSEGDFTTARSLIAQELARRTVQYDRDYTLEKAREAVEACYDASDDGTRIDPEHPEDRKWAVQIEDQSNIERGRE